MTPGTDWKASVSSKTDSMTSDLYLEYFTDMNTNKDMDVQ